MAAAARALSGPLVLMPQSPGWRLPSVCVRLPGTCRENPSHTCIGMLLLWHFCTTGCVMPSVCSNDQTGRLTETESGAGAGRVLWVARHMQNIIQHLF